MMPNTIPFTGFTPSIDPTIPGCILDCINMVPTYRGMRGAYSPQPYGNPALPSRCTGAAICELLNGTYRTFAGDATDIYEISNGQNVPVTENIGAVSGVTAVTSATGGTLAAGTYHYVVTALNASGETTVSNEVAVTTTGTTSSNTVS